MAAPADILQQRSRFRADRPGVVFRFSCDIKMRIFHRLFVENPRNSSLLLWFSSRFDEKYILFISRNLRETPH
jgi:hypothetical protein